VSDSQKFIPETDAPPPTNKSKNEAIRELGFTPKQVERFETLADNLARRKEIYEALHPETKKGAVNQYTKVLSAESADSTPSFVQDTASKTGVSTRVIHEEIQLANNLTPETFGWGWVATCGNGPTTDESPAGGIVCSARLSCSHADAVVRKLDP